MKIGLIVTNKHIVREAVCHSGSSQAPAWQILLKYMRDSILCGFCVSPNSCYWSQGLRGHRRRQLLVLTQCCHFDAGTFLVSDVGLFGGFYTSYKMSHNNAFWGRNEAEIMDISSNDTVLSHKYKFQWHKRKQRPFFGVRLKAQDCFSISTAGFVTVFTTVHTHQEGPTL